MPFEQLRFVFSCSESDQGWQRVLGPAARLPSALTTRQGGEGIPTPLTDVFAQCRFSGLATSSTRQAARFTPQNGLSEEHIPTEHEGKTKQKNLAARTRTTSPQPADTVGRRNLHKPSSSRVSDAQKPAFAAEPLHSHLPDRTGPLAQLPERSLRCTELVPQGSHRGGTAGAARTARSRLAPSSTNAAQQPKQKASAPRHGTLPRIFYVGTNFNFISITPATLNLPR